MLGDRTGPRRLDGQLVGEPVHGEVEDDRNAEGDQGALLPEEEPPGTHENATEQSEQRNGLRIVGHGVRIPGRGRCYRRVQECTNGGARHRQQRIRPRSQ